MTAVMCLHVLLSRLFHVLIVCTARLCCARGKSSQQRSQNNISTSGLIGPQQHGLAARPVYDLQLYHIA